MNILMICYYYPPLLDVGCKRSVAFSENFKKHGWNPLVIGVRNPDKNYCLLGNATPPVGMPVEYTNAIFNMYFFLGKINGLLARLLNLIGIKLRRNYLMDLFCIPDHFVGWIPLTVIKGVQVTKKQHIDVIYVSCSPFSSAVIGIMLKKIARKPLVVDFRDPFALKEVSSIFHTPVWRAKLNQAIESWIIKTADIFIVNTEEVKAAYLDQYPASKGKTYAVTNGFDFKYFDNKISDKFDKFTVIYAGLFYFFDKRNEIYTEAFFEGLANLKSKGQINKQNFQFLYFGDEREKICQIGRDHAVDELLVCHERKPYPEVLRNLKKAHLQLLRISKPMISTKLFEGIALNIPFLATIPSGEVEAIVNTYSPASYVVTEGSSEKVAEAILDSRNRYESGSVAANKIDDFEQHYSREKLSLRLMKIINEKLFDRTLSAPFEKEFTT